MGTAVFGAPEWLARSGRTVKANLDGSVAFEGMFGYIGPDHVMDAEEFFQAKRDADLGLWRSPVETHHVVREIDRDGYGRRRVRVLNETTLFVREVNEIVCTSDDAAHVAARGFFEAHPERKPWEDAQPGEVWLLTLAGRESAFIADRDDFTGMNESGSLICTLQGYHDSDITAGRRIWPEDES